MLSMLNLVMVLLLRVIQLGKISNVYDAQDDGINIYKTKSGSYIMDHAGMSVNSFTSDNAAILYASNGNYHKFNSDPKALDWHGDIKILDQETSE